MLIQSDLLAVAAFQAVGALQLDDLAVARLNAQLAAKAGWDVNAEVVITRLIVQCTTQGNRSDAIRGVRRAATPRTAMSAQVTEPLSRMPIRMLPPNTGVELNTPIALDSRALQGTPVFPIPSENLHPMGSTSLPQIPNHGSASNGPQGR